MVISEPERDRDTRVSPRFQTRLRIDGAPVRDQARLLRSAGRAQYNRVLMKSRVDIAQRRQELLKKLIARPVRLAHGRESPHVLLRGQSFVERGQVWRRTGSRLT